MNASAASRQPQDAAAAAAPEASSSVATANSAANAIRPGLKSSAGGQGRPFGVLM